MVNELEQTYACRQRTCECDVRCGRLWRVCVVALSLALLLPMVLLAQTADPQRLAIRAMPPTHSATAVRIDSGSIQERVNVLLAQLAIPQSVHVEVVQNNGYLASVKPIDDECTAFHLLLDAGFIEGLSEEELKATLAHELGHVWVYTHHPYLQTERLANGIALRLVSRDSLLQLYEKVSQRQGTTGDLVPMASD